MTNIATCLVHHDIHLATSDMTTHTPTNDTNRPYVAAGDRDSIAFKFCRRESLFTAMLYMPGVELMEILT